MKELKEGQNLRKNPDEKTYSELGKEWGTKGKQGLVASSLTGEGANMSAKNLKDAEYFMSLAIEEAKKAEEIGEVPIGAVVVYQGKVIGRGHNKRESSYLATSHAELLAINEANKNLNAWRLTDCDLYVTLEPCPMCSGAIILSRLRHVYFGARDEKAGCCGSLMNLLADQRFNHQVPLTEGICQEQCQQLLSNFFKTLRQRQQKLKKARQVTKRWLGNFK